MQWRVTLEAEAKGSQVVVTADSEQDAKAAALQWIDENRDAADNSTYQATDAVQIEA